MALRDVMDHAVRMEREMATRSGNRRSRPRGIVGVAGALALLALSAYSLIARPAFIWGQPYTQSPARADASLRFGMYLLAQRLEAFRAEAGQYPSSLGDVGEAVEGVRYTLVADSVFELRSAADTTVALRSDGAIDAFLGNSVRIIQGGER